MLPLDILPCLPARHLQGMDIAWSKSCSEAKHQVDGSERRAKLSNVWWAFKGAKLERMTQFGLKTCPFFLPGGQKWWKMSLNAAASSAILSLLLLPLPSWFSAKTQMIFNPFWVLELSENCQKYWDPQKNAFIWSYSDIPPNPTYTFKVVHRQHSSPESVDSDSGNPRLSNPVSRQVRLCSCLWVFILSFPPSPTGLVSAQDCLPAELAPWTAQ